MNVLGCRVYHHRLTIAVYILFLKRSPHVLKLIGYAVVVTAACSERHGHGNTVPMASVCAIVPSLYGCIAYHPAEQQSQCGSSAVTSVDNELFALTRRLFEVGYGWTNWLATDVGWCNPEYPGSLVSGPNRIIQASVDIR